MGLRFRINKKELPGKPDLTFRKHLAVIFVHGCFWHGHSCAKGRLPKSRVEFWTPKIERNRRRDASNLKEIDAAGWRALTIWECETKDRAILKNRLALFFNGRSNEVPNCPPVM
jgi:DNA mismatch endonuclease (patch repair protein)